MKKNDAKRSAQLFTPVILTGGSGTRLWPLSRAGFPKQFLCLTGKTSLFQQSIKRLANLPGAQSPIVLCNEDHRFLVQGQIEELARLEPRLTSIQEARLILEPVGRNTAPAMTLAALAQEPTRILVVTPADQIIADDEKFSLSISQAIDEAAIEGLIALGIAPDRPETGYGYIKTRAKANENNAIEVVSFTEKPNAKTAETYLQSGDYLWNAGIFVTQSATWLKALTKHRPDILDACQTAWKSTTTERVPGRHKSLTFTRPEKNLFESIPSESIDYAVMEPSPGGDIPVKVVPFAGGWDDLGAWDAVWKLLEKDDAGNVLVGDVLAEDCQNSLIYANHRLVTVSGVQDLVIVETADAVMVVHKNKSQAIKGIVDQLTRKGRAEQTLHRKVHRPWGWYDSIDEGDRFKVKRIQVEPGASLSLQKHHHRAEHWIVVRGTAEVTVVDKTLLLSENQSTYIPLGELHRLRNPGSIPLEIIEVQSGSYLGEDDIVRVDDLYGRKV